MSHTNPYYAINKNNVFLVDVSYVMYASFHKFKSLHKYTNPHDDQPFDITKHRQEFKNDIIKRMTGINTLRRKTGQDGKWLYDVGSNEPMLIKDSMHNVVLVRDCKRAKNWRLLEFPQCAYKARRDKQRVKFDDRTFDIVYLDLIPYLESIGVKVISLDSIIPGTHDMSESTPTPEMVGCAGAEADDIIGTVCIAINKKYPSKKVFIIGDDRDFVQLKNPMVEIVNLKGHDVFVRSMQSLQDDIEKYVKDTDVCVNKTPEMLLINKIVMGDRSDNILSCGRLSKAEATLLTVCPDALDRMIKSNASFGERFEMNRRMMDMNSINQTIRERILNVWNQTRFIRL